MGQQASVEGSGLTGDGSKNVMSAWVMETKTGKTDDMTCRDDVTIPQPEPGSVRVKVMAASLNYIDIKKATEGSHFPTSLGTDGAGIIDYIPEGTKSPLPRGSKVYFMVDTNSKYGTLCEYTIVPVDRLHVIQPNVSFASAAALPTAGWAAYYAIHYRMKVTSGKSIYVTGGGGGMGGFVCQLCKAAGLRVITSCSAYNAEYAASRGAQEIIDYTSLDVKTEIMKLTNDRGVDYCLDILDDTATINPLDIIAIGGHICVTNRLVKQTPSFLEKNISIHYINMPALSRSVQDIKPVADTVMHLVSKQSLDDNIGEIGRWNSVRGGYKTLESRHVRGKLVINIEPVHVRRKKLQSQPTYTLVPADQLKSLVESHPSLGSAQLSEDRLATASQPCAIIKKDKDLIQVQVGDVTFWVPEKAVQVTPSPDDINQPDSIIRESHAMISTTDTDKVPEVEILTSSGQGQEVPVVQEQEQQQQVPQQEQQLLLQQQQQQQQLQQQQQYQQQQQQLQQQQYQQQQLQEQQYQQQQGSVGIQQNEQPPVPQPAPVHTHQQPPPSPQQQAATQHQHQHSTDARPQDTTYSPSPTGGVMRPVASGAAGKKYFIPEQYLRHVEKKKLEAQQNMQRGGAMQQPATYGQ
eukprot:TRINITY_DN4152_c0_g2_i1.p1 TRINITY_DN4152_c0_g2~~TRINITY_DN4152_c0_g2_i1.p1  ORF type:complete len:649 (+),score=177.03 TRINITY_DN4152_c0_g2_i1:47-1948(+)